MNNNVRRITDGAMMVAIIGLTLVINRQFGEILVGLGLFLFPLPMVFFSAKYGWKDGLVPLSAIVLLVFILGTPQTWFYVISESICGLLYGNGIRTNMKTSLQVCMTMTVAILVNVISSVIFASFFGYDIMAEITEVQNTMTALASTQGVEIVYNGNMTQLLVTIYVMSSILSGVLEGYLTHFISRIMLKRLGFKVNPPLPVYMYKAPLWSGYVALGGFLVLYYFMNHPLDNQTIQTSIICIGMIGYIFLIGFGMIGSIVLGRIYFPTMYILVILAILFMLLTGGMALAFIGFLYITTNIRKKALEKVTGTNEKNDG